MTKPDPSYSSTLALIAAQLAASMIVEEPKRAQEDIAKEAVDTAEYLLSEVGRRHAKRLLDTTQEPSS